MMKDQKINKARALYYGMFSRFFVFSNDINRYYELVNLIDLLRQNPLDTQTAQAFSNLGEVIKSESNVPFMEEFDALFHSPQSKNIRVTASYYDEGVESGKKRVEMLQFLAKTKIRRDEKKYADYEDHIGFIFTFLAELCELQSTGAHEYDNTIHCIFEQILNEFVDEFAKNVYEHPSAELFKEVIVILKAFIEFERIYLEVSKPQPKMKAEKEPMVEEISEEEKARRARNKALKAQGPKNKQSENQDVQSSVEDDI